MLQERTLSSFTYDDGITLMKLNKQLSSDRIIPLCTSQLPHGTPVATFGLGSLSKAVFESSELPQSHLAMENIYFEKEFKSSVINDFSICEDDLLCIGRTYQSWSSCFYYSGNPLYTLGNIEGGGFCLASVSLFDNRKYQVNGRKCLLHQEIAKIDYFKEWIKMSMKEPP